MKFFSQLLLIVVLPACLIATINNQPEIKLTASKDMVLSAKQRTFILEAAESYLNRSDEIFLTRIEKVNDPYSSGGVVAPEVENSEVIVVYDDASILDLIQGNFSSQVRGTLAKGDTYYLQLNGGGMLEAGKSFPAQIPQVKGESFTVTILEITSEGYILKMNDVIQKVNFEKTSGIIKDSEK